MEGTDSNETTTAERPAYRQTRGSGAISEFLVDLQAFDPQTWSHDLEAYSCADLDQVLKELDIVESVCEAMIERFQASERHQIRQAEVLQRGVENTGAMFSLIMDEVKNMRVTEEKSWNNFVLPAPMTDLMMEDSSSVVNGPEPAIFQGD